MPVKPQRIVSLTLGTDEILMDIVAPERIAALTYLSDDSGISHISERSIQVKNKIKGNSAEAILALKPDLVLIADWWGLNILDTLREMGINVYVYKTPYTVADVKKTIREVAFIVGEAERGETVIRTLIPGYRLCRRKFQVLQTAMSEVLSLLQAKALSVQKVLFMTICVSMPASKTACRI